MEKTGLVLQGGGTRGVYTSGVLDFFLDKKVYFPYVIGVSAGACNGAAYVARQKGLGKIMYTKYIHDKRYIGFHNFLKEGSLLGMDFIFDEIPRYIEPFDLDMLKKSKDKFFIVATCCKSGKAIYFEKDQCSDVLHAIRASCSLPFITKIAYFEGKPFLDGGVSDPIPIKKSICDGNQKNVIVMTSIASYQKNLKLSSWLTKKLYIGYEELCRTIYNNHEIYNKTIDYIVKLENENKVFIIKPSEVVKMKVTEKNKKKLQYLYDMGYNDAKNGFEQMMNYLES